MNTPTYNADGEAVWKPQPGTHYPGGLKYVQSYGGIISALQDIQAAKGMDIKSYPNNFAGIIAAIEDLELFLTEGNLPDVGAPPPGWEIIINPDGSIDGDWQQEPPDGTLWFDTRQGRLFIAIDGEFYQTNGADGISHVGPLPPTNPPVIGQHWLDVTTGVFYVYVGEGIWQAVVSDGDINLTTATLPLATQHALLDPTYTPTILPELKPDDGKMETQQDFNAWLFECQFALEQAINESSVTISETPPTDNVVPGTLWYDSQTLELSIYYQDNDSAQWVPVSVGFAVEEIVAPIESRLNDEIATRAAAVDNLYSMISEMDNVDDARVGSLEQNLTALETVVSGIEVPDITPLATKAEVQPIENRVAALENEEVDLSAYATTASVNAVQQSLLDTINSKTYLELSDITPLIPDVSDKVEMSDITQAIDNAASEFITRSGGNINGRFNIIKDDVDLPTFDVSSSWYNSQNLLKLKSYSPTYACATFGATDNWWEYAWNFDGDEDFAWVYADNNKVFSISKDGPACSQLHIGTFRENDANGRSLANTIEVGAELRKYKQTFADLLQTVSNSTDYISLKTGLIQVLSNV